MISCFFSSSSQKIKLGAASATREIPNPTRTQLRAHYISNGLPFIGFGMMDQTVMIQAGNVIDCTIGVTFGLSTLSAAAVGGLISNVCGILFGGTLESAAKAAGLPSSNLTAAQRALPYVKINRLFSQALGVLLGCTLGLVNLFFIDHEKSSSLKLQQQTEDREFAFEVEASNEDIVDATVFTVRGPDNDGLLAGITASLTMRGCSIINIAVEQFPDGTIVDTFTVVDQKTRTALDDNELMDVSRELLDATTKDGPLFLRTQLGEIEDQNSTLKKRIEQLEEALMKRRVTLRSSQPVRADRNKDC